METSNNPLKRTAMEGSRKPDGCKTGNAGKFCYAEIALAVLVIAFVVINARWIWLFCHAQVLDIDESGYLAIALSFYYSLIHGGLINWITTVGTLTSQAPLTTALTSLLFCITGPHAIAGFSVPLLAGVIVVVTTYYLGKSLSSTWVGLISSLLVASTPVIINFSRSYHFAIPATAAMTAALLALLRSDRFMRTGWSTVFGICVGLLPLARTMTIAFLPGLVLAACFHAAGAPNRKRALLDLTWALFVAAITALVWYGPNAQRVFGYLFNFGYGAQAAEYGQKSSLFQLDDWFRIVRTFVDDLYLPHFLVLLAGAAAMVFVALRRVTRHRDALVRQILASQQIPILICIGEALAALSSSIPGSAFIAPIVPAAMTLAVAALYEIQPNLAAYRRTLAATACAIALTAALPLIDLTWPIARPWTAAVPVLGQSTITDGRGGNQKYEASGGFSSKNPAQPVEPDQSRLWLDLSTRTATALRRQGGNIPVTAFGFRHFLYNVNTVSLQHAAMGGQLLPLRQVAPTVTGSSTRGYLDWLDGESADACLLLTMNGNRAQFIPLVISDNMREAAVQAKFVPIEHWSTPDNQEVTLWKRSVSRCDSSS